MRYCKVKESCSLTSDLCLEESLCTRVVASRRVKEKTFKVAA